MSITEIGYLVRTKPESAWSRLVALFARHRTRRKVADVSGADPATVLRWIDRLESLGFEDPRVEAKRRSEKVRSPYRIKSA